MNQEPFRTKARAPLTALVVTAAFLEGCVFLPVTATEYDSRCELTRRHMMLRPHQLDALIGRQNEGCGALLVLAGAFTAASVVVSGSVAVVGDTAYWLQDEGQCRRR